MTTERSESFCAFCSAPFGILETGSCDSNNGEQRSKEHGCYDSDLLDIEDMRWLQNVWGMLTYYPDDPYYKLVQLRYDATHVPRNCFAVVNPDNGMEDLPDDGDQWYSYAYPPDVQPLLFPFHKHCLDLFRRCQLRSTKRVDYDRLYQSMTQLCEDNNLNIPYGEIRGPSTNGWYTEPGEEFSVCSPQAPALVMKCFQGNKLFYKNDTTSLPNLSRKVRRDPFGHLPYEILRMILEYLSASEIMCLNRASWIVHRHPHDPTHWRRRIREAMPWFWELSDFLDEPENSDIDVKRAYLYSDWNTSPKYGHKGLLMAVANRRRIWGVCELLVERCRVNKQSPLPLGEWSEWDE
ncbi:hypothetical protein BJX99DRAFT_157651 [Aspergillus californicus]